MVLFNPPEPSTMLRFLFLIIYYLHQSEAYSIKIQGKVDLGKDLGVLFKDAIQDIIINKEGKSNVDLGKLLALNLFNTELELSSKNEIINRSQTGKIKDEDYKKSNKEIDKTKAHKQNETVENQDLKYEIKEKQTKNSFRVTLDNETRESKTHKLLKKDSNYKIGGNPNNQSEKEESKYEIEENQSKIPLKEGLDSDISGKQNEHHQKEQAVNIMDESQSNKPLKQESHEERDYVSKGFKIEKFNIKPEELKEKKYKNNKREKISGEIKKGLLKTHDGRSKSKENSSFVDSANTEEEVIMF